MVLNIILNHPVGEQTLKHCTLLDVVAHTCNPALGRTAAGQTQVSAQPGLDSEFQPSQGFLV